MTMKRVSTTISESDEERTIEVILAPESEWSEDDEFVAVQVRLDPAGNPTTAECAAAALRRAREAIDAELALLTEAA